MSPRNHQVLNSTIRSCYFVAVLQHKASAASQRGQSGGDIRVQPMRGTDRLRTLDSFKQIKILSSKENVRNHKYEARLIQENPLAAAGKASKQAGLLSLGVGGNEGQILRPGTSRSLVHSCVREQRTAFRCAEGEHRTQNTETG